MVGAGGTCTSHLSDNLPLVDRIANRYVQRRVVGVVDVYKRQGEHPGRLKDGVCSPGGATIQGVRALEKGAFRSAVFEAVVEAYIKTTKLAE